MASSATSQELGKTLLDKQFAPASSEREIPVFDLTKDERSIPIEILSDSSEPQIAVRDLTNDELDEFKKVLGISTKKLTNPQQLDPQQQGVEVYNLESNQSEKNQKKKQQEQFQDQMN